MIRLFLAGVVCVGSAIAATLPNDYARGVNDVAGFASADGFQHAMALHAGIATEIYFKSGISTADVAAIPSALAIDGRESADFDRHRVLVIAQTDGDIHEVWFRSDGDVGSRFLANIPGVTDVALMEDANGALHIPVLGAGGRIDELTTTKLEAVARRNLTTIPGATRLSGFVAGDDHRCIVIVGTADGHVFELFYVPGGAPGKSTLRQGGAAIRDVAAFYTADDKFRHALVLDGSGLLQEIFYSPTNGLHAATLQTGVNAGHLAGYVTSDGWRHAILGGVDGTVRELAYGTAGRTNSVLTTIADATPQAVFVGPTVDAQHAAITSAPSPTGLTFALSGDAATTYAVSNNAGVWRGGGGLPWVSLPTSPRFAQSIGVDPTDRTHVFVGERDGDAGPAVASNNAGLWESSDLGVHWSYVLDPLAQTGTSTCSSQAVPSVFSTADGGALAATQCGIARRKGRQGVFQPLAGFEGKGPFSGVAQTSGCSKDFIWGRTLRNLVWSVDDGASTNQVSIPSTAPDSSGKAREILTADGTRGEGFGFATYGCRAAFVVRVNDASALSPRLASLEFDAVAGTWFVDPVDVGVGTGLGGRIFIKSQQGGPGLTSKLGQPFGLLMSGAQTVFLGTPRGDPRRSISARGIQWRAAAESPWNPTPPDHYLLSAPSAIHSDIWDAHLVEHPSEPSLYIATDGGVFGTALGQLQSTPSGQSPPYLAVNAGMETQHVHVMELIDPDFAHRSGVLTAAVDNDAWWQASVTYSTRPAPWHSGLGLGDGNYVFADPRMAGAAIGWRHNSSNGLVRNLTSEPPATTGGTTVYPAAHFRSEHQFSIAPRVDPATPYTLDVVALARTGQTAPDSRSFKCDGIVPPSDAVDGTGWHTQVVRSRDFASHRQIGLPNPVGAGWTLEAEAPEGSERVWVSRGANPLALFFYAENDTTGVRVLFRKRAGQSFAVRLPGLENTLFPTPYCAVQGPVFPNPYDENVAWGIGTDGVWRLVGESFQRDDVLTALVSGSGTYPMLANYTGDTAGNGGDGLGLYLHASQSRALSSLVDVAFDVADTYRVAAASAFGAVFYMDRRENIWRDLSAYLPKPGTEIANVAIAHDGIYVAFEGRSIWRVQWPELAPEAAFFTPPNTLGFGRLLRSSGRPIAGASVSVIVRNTPTQSGASFTVVSGNDGNVPFPPGKSAADFSGRSVRVQLGAGSDYAATLRSSVL